MTRFWGHDRYRENLEYAVAGTPCEIVMRDEAVFYADGVQERFAGDVFLAARRHGGWLRSVWQRRGTADRARCRNWHQPKAGEMMTTALL